MHKILPASFVRMITTGSLGLILAAGALMWIVTPVHAANEVSASGIRCNSKQGSRQVIAKDWYVYFDSDSSKVRAEDYEKIRHILGIAKGHSARQICLFGKASKIGDAAGNARLGEKRAANVAREFEALGWPSNKIVIGTEGEAWGWMEEMLTSDAKADRRVRIRLSL